MSLRTFFLDKRFLRWTCLLLLSRWLAAHAFAQVSTATLMGVVQDSAKASILNARVRLISTETGTENDSTTSREGAFLLPGILPGAYTLQIEQKGFATTQVSGITLNVGDTKNLLIRMKVGSVTETVTVDASGLTMNATDATVSTVVDRGFVSAIPLNGRSFQDLITLTPGIVTQSPQAATLGTGSGTQDDFSVNGQSLAANVFFVDGISTNVTSGLSAGQSRLASTGSIQGLTALGTTQSLVSVDALQEFRVLSSTYSAEYGRTPGGQFTFQTRSGTRTIHGSSFYYARYSFLDADDWFSKTNPSAYSLAPTAYAQKDFGGTLGVPVVLPHVYSGRDKTFIFLSYEGLYVDQPTPQSYPYTPAVCNPDTFPPADIVTCNEAPYDIPYALGPVLGAFPGYPYLFPVASDPEIVDAAGNPTGMAHADVLGSSFPSHVNASSIRVDQTFSPRFSIFLRYGVTPSYGQSNQLYSMTTNQAKTQTFTFGATNQLSAERNNDFRLGYVRTDGSAIAGTVQSGVVLSPATPSVSLNIGLGIPNPYSSASADAYVHIVGVGDSDSNTNQIASSLHQWNLRDTFSLQARNHLLKFGIDERHVSASLTPPVLSVQADFFDRNSMATNSASNIVITKSSPANPVLNEFSAFAEDEWKLSNALTLSLGLRWDVNPAPKGQNGQDAYTVLGDINAPATLQLAPRGTPLWHTSWLNFAPRLGAAWVANDEPGKELIVRAGGGVFFDTGTQPALQAFNGIGFATSAHYSNVPVPVTQSQLTFSTAVAPPYTNATAFAFSPHLQLPYSFQWNIALEKALGKDQSITVSYVGANGHRLLHEQRRNVSQFNPNFGDIFYFPSGSTSSYQSLQTKFQRTFSHGVEALASYTWAHSLDYGSTDPAFPLVRGNSDLDVRHDLEAAASWDFSPPGRRWLSFERFIEGWGLDGRLIARTGFPVDLLGNFFFDPVTGNPYYSGVDLIPGRPLYVHNSEYPGHRIFNGGPNVANPAFALPSGMNEGNAPRNLLRGFGEVQANTAIRQDFHLHDRTNLQFKGEIFNVFNHPNFGYVDPHLSDLLFGQSTKMLNQSFGAAGALYDQGGPRSIQLSLKFVF